MQYLHIPCTVTGMLAEVFVVRSTPQLHVTDCLRDPRGTYRIVLCRPAVRHQLITVRNHLAVAFLQNTECEGIAPDLTSLCRYCKRSVLERV